MSETDFRSTFVAALRAGDEIAARALVAEALSSGLAPSAIYLDVFAPSMVMIGELWERNELSVAEEHMATAITERLIGELSPWFNQAQHGRITVVLGCVQNENHTLGLRMLADLLRKNGWRVLYLGANVPTEDWVRLVVRSHANAVAISVNIQRHVLEAQALIAELRAAAPGLQVLVGGAAFNRNPELWRTVGADLYHPDPLTATAELTARCITELGAAAPGYPSLVTGLGS